MLLAVDVGNTNVVFALYDGPTQRTRWRIATDPRRTADEYAVWLLQLMALHGIDRVAVTDVIVATVVPRALHNLSVLAHSYFGVEPKVAGRPPVEWRMAIDVVEPHTVGADRLINALAAHALVAGDLIVVDFGTATTFDVVDFTGAYKGGIIAPGLNLSLDALVAAAAKLPRIALEAPETDEVIGRTTEDQMLIGVYWGYVGLIEGLVGRLRERIGRPTTVLATGGLAALFDRHSTVFDRIVPDLTLDGLALLHADAT